MSTVEPPKQFNSANVTASVSGILIGLAALIPEDKLPTSAKSIVAMLIGIISPYISAMLVRAHRKLDIDPKLMDLKNRLDADFKTQGDLLKKKGISEEAKALLQKKREATMLRLATLNQDFNDGAIVLKERGD